MILNGVLGSFQGREFSYLFPFYGCKFSHISVEKHSLIAIFG